MKRRLERSKHGLIRILNWHTHRLARLTYQAYSKTHISWQFMWLALHNIANSPLIAVHAKISQGLSHSLGRAWRKTDRLTKNLKIHSCWSMTPAPAYQISILTLIFFSFLISRFLNQQHYNIFAVAKNIILESSAIHFAVLQNSSVFPSVAYCSNLDILLSAESLLGTFPPILILTSLFPPRQSPSFPSDLLQADRS